MGILYAIVTALVLVVTTTAMHYEGLRLTYRYILGMSGSGRRKILAAILIVFWIHLLEIGLYAIAYWFADKWIDIGSFAGSHVFEPLSYFYFSAETFTTLGLGDIYPIGPLRLLASIEPINGLLLLGWSASFSYYLMQRCWDEERTASR
ncbi:ion channel [Emcibacter sp. SYSU 3D8]|uniref:ion channel n=1 Tax=Emcibacter sp. SYSU 3D8 TaxID=3133969 RepID=UPI0031FF3550